MYNALKTEISQALGITKDALHIHLGLAIFLGVAFIFRRPLTSLIPWLALLAFELVNELMDMFHLHNGTIGFEIGDSVKDVLNTMFWPTIVLLAARWIRRRKDKKGAVEMQAQKADTIPYSDAATDRA